MGFIGDFKHSLAMSRMVKKIHKENKDNVLIISADKGIGDLCILFAYLPEYLRSKGKTSFKIILPNNTHTATLTKQFGLGEDTVILIDGKKKKMFDESIHKIFFRLMTEKLRNEGVLIMGSTEFHAGRLLYKIPSFNFLDLYKYGVFGLSDDAPIRYPEVEKPANLQKLQDPYIILNPYSYSSKIPLSFFSDLADKLKSMGYSVYSNCAPGQKPIEGTIPLTVSIEELYHLSKDAECIISVRSGILDYVVSNARRIVALCGDNDTLYPYTLKAWKTGCEVHEHLYEKDIDTDMIVKEATGHGN